MKGFELMQAQYPSGAPLLCNVYAAVMRLGNCTRIRAHSLGLSGAAPFDSMTNGIFHLLTCLGLGAPIPNGSNGLLDGDRSFEFLFTVALFLGWSCSPPLCG